MNWVQYELMLLTAAVDSYELVLVALHVLSLQTAWLCRHGNCSSSSISLVYFLRPVLLFIFVVFILIIVNGTSWLVKTFFFCVCVCVGKFFLYFPTSTCGAPCLCSGKCWPRSAFRTRCCGDMTTLCTEISLSYYDDAGFLCVKLAV